MAQIVSIIVYTKVLGNSVAGQESGVKSLESPCVCRVCVAHEFYASNAYGKHVGGLDNAATILSGLAENFDPVHSHIPLVQRFLRDS